jgi:uncharacterized protein
MAAQKARPAKSGTRSRRAGGQPKRVPQRTCVGCWTVLPKRQLVRLVRQPDGSVQVDPSGKAAGRGAYLHDRQDCWQRALTSRTLDQALKTDITEAERARLRAVGEQYKNDDV